MPNLIYTMTLFYRDDNILFIHSTADAFGLHSHFFFDYNK